MGRFGVGQPVPRSEDPRLLTGRGRYAADVALPGQLSAFVLRSPHAHADIAGIDVTAAATAAGVHAVATGGDVAAAGLGDIPCAVPVRDADGEPLPRPGRRLLARDRVRFVGEPVAMVVAETVAQAADAAALIAVDYRPLPAVATMADALADGAPRLWDGAPGNIAFHWQRGDAAAVERAFAAAHHITRLDLVNNRVVPCAMEPRAVVAAFDAASGRYTLYTASQGAHQIKEALARHTLKVPEEALHVIVGDVGGGFGTKIFHYPEEALALWAAKRLGRPVKWTGDRWEAFVGDTHGRDQHNRAAAAFDRDGRMVALRVETAANMGAYLNMLGPTIPSQMTGGMLPGAYAIPMVFAVCRGVYTNTVPVDAYRGAGRPEAAYVIERLMDAAARELGLAAAEIRRRNFIRPEQMPYTTSTRHTYDSGDFARNMDDALAAADWSGFEARRAAARARGRLRGIGLSTYVEVCAYEAEEATIRFAEDGHVEVLIGTQSTGQGHETAYAQIASDALGVPFERIRVIQGDTDRIPFGKGTSGSRSLPVGGSAVVAAAEAGIARGTPVARHLLQAGDREIVFAEGRFGVAGTDRAIAIDALAAAARDPENLPPGTTAPGLDATGRYTLQAPTYPNGCHVCEIEIDPETGAPTIVGYTVVDDFGTVINPLLLAGQVQGGIAQGIGQALIEEAVYDRCSAQPLTGSFADYRLPRAGDVPDIVLAFNTVPCATNPLGVKGAGEAGAIGACPAVINAVIDALAPLGVRHIDMPATAEAIWRAIRTAPRPPDSGDRP
ncbi:MAG: xanthine dehydrogenase family protein molybdopterin-binding subunit [Rhodospirillales bacterium]